MKDPKTGEFLCFAEDDPKTPLILHHEDRRARDEHLAQRRAARAASAPAPAPTVAKRHTPPPEVEPLDDEDEDEEPDQDDDDTDDDDNDDHEERAAMSNRSTYREQLRGLRQLEVAVLGSGEIRLPNPHRAPAKDEDERRRIGSDQDEDEEADTYEQDALRLGSQATLAKREIAAARGQNIQGLRMQSPDATAARFAAGRANSYRLTPSGLRPIR